MTMPLPPVRRRRARPGLITVAVLAAVAVTAAILHFRPASGQAPGLPPPRPTSNTEGRVPARTPGSPAAGTVSTTGWRAVALDGALLPASPQAGPRQGPWPVAAGYADTPQGAVLAAIGIAVRASGQLGPDIFGVTIRTQVTGPGAAAMLAAARQDYAQASAQHRPASPGGPAGPLTASPRAFRLMSFTAAAAAIQVLAAAAGTQAVVLELHVRWLGGDWRLLAPPSGNLADAAVRPATLAGFQALPGR